MAAVQRFVPWAGGHLCCSEPRRSRRRTCLSRASSGSASAIHSPGCCTRCGTVERSRGRGVPAGRLKDRVVVGRGRPFGPRRRDGIERAAPLVVVALRHLALQGEELAALGHLHEDPLHTERAELVRDRAIRAAASCCLRHRVTLPRCHEDPDSTPDQAFLGLGVSSAPGRRPAGGAGLSQLVP